MSFSHQIFEPIDVIIHCTKNLELNIIKFKWNNNIYKVTEMLQSWSISAGEGYAIHFIVICREQDIMCELSLSHKDKKMKWELVQYDSLT